MHTQTHIFYTLSLSPINCLSNRYPLTQMLPVSVWAIFLAVKGIRSPGHSIPVIYGQTKKRWDKELWPVNCLCWLPHKRHPLVRHSSVWDSGVEEGCVCVCDGAAFGKSAALHMGGLSAQLSPTTDTLHHPISRPLHRDPTFKSLRLKNSEMPLTLIIAHPIRWSVKSMIRKCEQGFFSPQL